MNIVTVEQLEKSYGVKRLFADVTFGIEEGEKIGLIGVNGTGKSSFLKIIAGLEQPDSGKVTTGNKITIEYVPQNPHFDPNATVLQQVFRGNGSIMKVLMEYQQTLGLMEVNPDQPDLQNRLVAIQQQMDALGAWQLESEAKTVLTKLGVTGFGDKMGVLSGGQRKRVALASALINPSDLLILDEPTNHIDHDTVDWLEQYLSKRKGAVLMVTHDRYFLDRVVNRILELDQGHLYSYSGDYRYFLEKKAEREQQQQASENKRQNLLRRELAWIQRGAKARTTKQKARIDRFEQLQSEKPEIVSNQIDISTLSSRLGKKIFELEHIRKTFSGKCIIDDFSYIAVKDDRVGIIGPNGRGKSTLLKIIAGQVRPDHGNIEIGQTVKIGVFSQESEEMNDEQRVIEYIKEAGEYLPNADGGTISASQMLERFLFPGSVQWTPIGKLSGGEKRRLHLLRILMEAPNVLLLDEPTNDLDVHTLTILEEYLEEFQGVVITVSHDRYFLDRVVDKLFVFEGEGKIRVYYGNYTEYMEATRNDSSTDNSQKSQKNQEGRNKEDTGTVGESEQKKERPLKFSYKEQREYEQIDQVIEQAEQELQNVNKQISTAGSDFELTQRLFNRKQELEEELEQLMERWAYLNELAEKIAQQAKR